jgi:hypothetical protein
VIFIEPIDGKFQAPIPKFQTSTKSQITNKCQMGRFDICILEFEIYLFFDAWNLGFLKNEVKYG